MGGVYRPTADAPKPKLVRHCFRVALPKVNQNLWEIKRSKDLLEHEYDDNELQISTPDWAVRAPISTKNLRHEQHNASQHVVAASRWGCTFRAPDTDAPLAATIRAMSATFSAVVLR